ncbi:MAG: phosphopentomutase [Clostridiales bacterium]|nr:phosphopentomutase [Clostridiales bacterium]
MMNFKRVTVIVLDSLGIGHLNDAHIYGDVGANTLKHTWEAAEGVNMPNLIKLGIGNVCDIGQGVKNPKAYYGKLKEASVGKDTMAGHWEMMGLKVEKPFVSFTESGFPQSLLTELSKAAKREIIGNKSASGTEIIDEYGERQMKTGELIVYTSADSVLQIAAHEDIIPPEELWQICREARRITMKDEWKVGRIIARPYVGPGKGQFTRTSNRHDYAVKPFERTVLNTLKDNGFDVISVGKINDIFDTEGITEAYPNKSNEDGMNHVIRLLDKSFNGLMFVNLVDFDAMYGHRRDPAGYAKCIESFDLQLTGVLEKLDTSDLLIITADHGTDPTFKGTDHTREYVPLLIFNKGFKKTGDLGEGSTFANIGATIAENFNVKPPKNGESYLNRLV